MFRSPPGRRPARGFVHTQVDYKPVAGWMDESSGLMLPRHPLAPLRFPRPVGHPFCVQANKTTLRRAPGTVRDLARSLARTPPLSALRRERVPVSELDYFPGSVNLWTFCKGNTSDIENAVEQSKTVIPGLQLIPRASCTPGDFFTIRVLQ